GGGFLAAEPEIRFQRALSDRERTFCIGHAAGTGALDRANRLAREPAQRNERDGIVLSGTLRHGYANVRPRTQVGGQSRIRSFSFGPGDREAVSLGCLVSRALLSHDLVRRSG